MIFPLSEMVVFAKANPTRMFHFGNNKDCFGTLCVREMTDSPHAGIGFVTIVGCMAYDTLDERFTSLLLTESEVNFGAPLYSGDEIAKKLEAL